MAGLTARRLGEGVELRPLREPVEIPAVQHLDGDALLRPDLPPRDPVLVEDACELALDRMRERCPALPPARTHLHAGWFPRGRIHKRGEALGKDLCSLHVSHYELLTRRANRDSSRVVVDLSGELDLTNAREIEERLDELATDGDATLVLDVNRVVFIDSAALHALFRIARRLGKDRFQLVFEQSAVIARTLAIVGMPEVATVGDSADDV